MAVVQAVLICGSYMWVMFPFIGRTLGVFRHWMVFWLTGLQLIWQVCGSCLYPPLVEDIEKAGLEEVEKYVVRHYNTVSKIIATRSIMYLCLAAVRLPGVWVSKRWC